jgi:hypothetical protein
MKKTMTVTARASFATSGGAFIAQSCERSPAGGLQKPSSVFRDRPRSSGNTETALAVKSLSDFYPVLKSRDFPTW